MALIPVSAVSSPIAVTVASVLTDSEESGCTVGEEKSGRRIGRLRTLTFLGSLTFGFGGVGIGGKSEACRVTGGLGRLVSGLRQGESVQVHVG